MSPSKAAVEAAEEIKGVAANYTHHWPQALTDAIARIYDRRARSAEVIRERDVLRAIIDGMKFEHIDRFLTVASVEDGRRLGELAHSRMVALSPERALLATLSDQ